MQLFSTTSIRRPNCNKNSFARDFATTAWSTTTLQLGQTSLLSWRKRNSNLLRRFQNRTRKLIFASSRLTEWTKHSSNLSPKLRWDSQTWQVSLNRKWWTGWNNKTKRRSKSRNWKIKNKVKEKMKNLLNWIQMQNYQLKLNSFKIKKTLSCRNCALQRTSLSDLKQVLKWK